MLPEVTTLLVLQDRDLKLRRLRLDLKKAPELEARAKEAVALNEVAINKIELDIGTRRTSISRLKGQQLITRKNEEFRALEHEIDRYTADVSTLEDSQLVLMEKGENLRAVVATATTSLAETQAVVDAELAQLALKQTTAREQISSLEAERYDRIFASKAPAVVPLDNGICGGCHMKVTATTLGNVKADKSLNYCEQCARLLYRGDC
jgi:uncharacterized protein